MRVATVVGSVFVNPPEWMTEAACAGADLDLFFPNQGNSNNAEALAYCHRCPVRTQCLEYALGYADRDLPGIWGGLNENQRNKLRRTRSL